MVILKKSDTTHLNCIALLFNKICLFLLIQNYLSNEDFAEVRQSLNHTFFRNLFYILECISSK